MRENTEEILKALTRLLQMTRNCENLDALLYDNGSKEVVVIINGNEAMRVNAASDSGFGIIKDVVNHLPA